MLFLIITLVIVSLVASVSIFLNITLYKHYDPLVSFFIDVSEDVDNDFKFFDKLCKMHLLMNDPFVMELIERLKVTRSRFETYNKRIESIKKENK